MEEYLKFIDELLGFEPKDNQEYLFDTSSIDVCSEIGDRFPSENRYDKKYSFVNTLAYAKETDIVDTVE